MSEQIFSGYVELNHGEGIAPITIVKDETGYAAWVNDALRDDLYYTDNYAQEFIDEVGLKLYNNLEDFKRGNSISADKVLI